jgi:hypothetical protein
VKRKLRNAIILLLLICAAVFAAAFSALGSMMPEQLVAAQIHRPFRPFNPTDMPLPEWFIDLHWRLVGERKIDAENRSAPWIVHYMLGAELQRGRSELSLDRERFHALMRRYVCAAPSGIPTPAEISRYTKLEAVPEYMAALKACGRI